MVEKLAATEKTRLHRLPKRGSHEMATIYEILDEGFVAHVGFVSERSYPIVIPTGYARRGDEILIHGSSASRMMRTLSGEVEVCFTVTLADGLVLARSAFHHSMNYRSVVAFGFAKLVEGEAEKTDALMALTEHIVPGRWREVRPPTANELKATTVLALPLTEASAKVRTGAPIDDEEDYGRDVWAGILPLSMETGTPVPDPRMVRGIRLPDHISHYRRHKRGDLEGR